MALTNAQRQARYRARYRNAIFSIEELMQIEVALTERIKAMWTVIQQDGGRPAYEIDLPTARKALDKVQNALR